MSGTAGAEERHTLMSNEWTPPLQNSSLADRKYERVDSAKKAHELGAFERGGRIRERGIYFRSKREHFIYRVLV